MVIPTHIAEKGAAPSFREREETRRFYTETLLHTESFTHKHFYTQTLSHRDVFHAHTQTHFHTETFTRKHFNTQTLLYTDSFTHTHTLLHADAFLQTHTHFHTQTLLHTDAFAHRHRRFSTRTLLHTDAFTHKHFYTHTLLHTDAFTRKHFYIQALLHTDAFTLRHFYTQTLFHTDPFTHRRFYTQTLLHTDASTETFTQRRSQSAARDLSCKQRCANIVAMEMLKNRKSAQDQAQYHDQRTIQCKTFPSANETATTKRPQTSRVRDFKQTFCIQKFRDMHICSLAFKTMPWHAWFQNKIERYKIERYNDSRIIFLSTAHAFQWKHHIYFFVLYIT